MANSGAVSFSIRATMDSGGAISGSKSLSSIVPVGDDVYSATQGVGTSAEALALGDLTSTTAAWIAVLASASNTNQVQVGFDQGGTKYYFADLDAGDFAVFVPKDGETYYILGGAASQEVNVFAFQV